MLQQSTFTFLKNLEQNNNKPWFDEQRPKYETARENIVALAEQLIAALAKFEPAMGLLQAKQTTFRINRDVRFSKNKLPYKNNMAIYLNARGKKSDTAGYYLHLQPGNSFLAAGVWHPPADILGKIRQEIDYNFAEWKKILNAAAFKKNFVAGIDNEDSLVRAPKGYEEENEAIQFLKLKSFVARKSLTDAEVMDAGFVKNAAGYFKALKPMLDFINRSME